jgi:ankyrin repeat protein
MSEPKRTHDETAAAERGAGGAPPPPPPPALRRPAARSAVAEAFENERRLKLTDVIGFVAQNGYAREADACAGLCHETWRSIPAWLSAADADRVRRDHPLWQAIIDLKQGKYSMTRLSWAAYKGKLSRVRELCDWHANVEAADKEGRTPLRFASCSSHLDVVRELLARGANIEAAMNDGATSLYVASQCGNTDVVRELLARGANVEVVTIGSGFTPLIMASCFGHVDVVRALLAAGASKRHVLNNGVTATSLAGAAPDVKPAAKAAVLALLAAAP